MDMIKATHTKVKNLQKRVYKLYMNERDKNTMNSVKITAVANFQELNQAWLFESEYPASLPL